MKLTPIKVKGKLAHKKTWKPPEKPAAQASKKRQSKKRQRDADGDDIPQPLQRRFKSSKPAAAIEELPTEILERIIIMSRNLNFLRSSLRIGYRFSSRSFMSELLVAAFEPTWEMWLGYPKSDAILRCTRERVRFNNRMLEAVNYPLLKPESVPGDPDFQSSVLACTWVNTAVILEAQQKWYRKNGGPGDLPRHLDSPIPPSVRPSLGNVDDVDLLFQRDWDEFKASCGIILSVEIKGLSPSIVQPTTLSWRPRYMELHPLIKIPERLITGPFDWEVAKTTFWLVRGGVTTKLDQAWSWEVTKRGFDIIITLSDKELMVTLLLLWAELECFRNWPPFLWKSVLEEAVAQLDYAYHDDDRNFWRALSLLRRR
ncbi:uncharacterized protein C8A04DRAFT_10667 [Dichotomopilus funicola]|uniref:Uncharacterized protein n=1 Tax=Dichotomopilus funicola TaxID=1934379 RepID=A0AAN6V6L4_9PEZI|nr:hypothetical protein C8A04DRAFT_10667 [Dichotomopilus funicola]